MWEGPMHPCGFASSSAGSSHYKMWAGLNGFDPRNNIVLSNVRMCMDSMNLVTVISRYSQVFVTLRWRASNVTQPCNNWRCGLQFTALERPSRSCRGHPRCHATCLVPRLFLGLYWRRNKLSTTLYVLRTMTMPTVNLGEIPCYFFCMPQKSAKRL